MGVSSVWLWLAVAGVGVVTWFVAITLPDELLITSVMLLGGLALHLLGLTIAFILMARRDLV